MDAEWIRKERRLWDAIHATYRPSPRLDTRGLPPGDELKRRRAEQEKRRVKHFADCWQAFDDWIHH